MSLDKMVIKEVQVKGIITKSNLPDADYVVNPYVGCQHACNYCYAEFMKRFTNHDEDWGSFVDVKANALDVLGNIERVRGKKVLFSSVTDPYHPVEARYQLTRKLLQALVPAQPRVEILTKGRMVTRDIDILTKYDDATVGVSIATLDENASRSIEPLAALPRLRLDAIKKCKEAGLKTYVFLSPIFPGITEVEDIVQQAALYVDYFMFENLNLRPLNTGRVMGYIRENHPELQDLYNQIYVEKDVTFWDKMEDRIRAVCQSVGKEPRIYFHHGGFDKK